jgi:hypothetical protein
VLYDKDDKMARLVFCRDYLINPETEKRARVLGWPWPPYIMLGKRVFYSRQRCREWFDQQDARSQSLVGAPDA